MSITAVIKLLKSEIQTTICKKLSCNNEIITFALYQPYENIQTTLTKLQPNNNYSDLAFEV